MDKGDIGVIVAISAAIALVVVMVMCTSCTVSVGQRNNKEPAITEAPTPGVCYVLS